MNKFRLLILTYIVTFVVFCISAQQSVSFADLPITSSQAIDTSQMTDPVRCTVGEKFNDQLLYFTSTSLLKDDTHLIFISDKTGNPNLFIRDIETGDEKQLTYNTDGLLKSYVYFDGQPYKGFGKASVSVDETRGLIYYIQGKTIMVVDKNGHNRVLATYPDKQMTAFTHVSADGTMLCVPTCDERTLEGYGDAKGCTKYDIDLRVRTEKLNSYLRVYDTNTGKEILYERVPKAWITHVQFSPINNNLILYNHEYTYNSGIQRMWLWNGKEHKRIRTEGNGRTKEDWTCHEMWQRDGKYIIYHGTYDKGSSYIGRVNPDGSNAIEIKLPSKWAQYGHFTVGAEGLIVTDGYYSNATDNSSWGGKWICLLKTDWEKKEITWVPLCKNGSTWRSQDEHPHPIFNHASNAIFFTSDKTGKRAVYKVKVQE